MERIALGQNDCITFRALNSPTQSSTSLFRLLTLTYRHRVIIINEPDLQLGMFALTPEERKVA
jgi:hypothetical protein